jgi:predicted amidohydrolase
MVMTIALAQYPITYHQSIEAWQLHSRQWVADAVAKGAQLLVFPEYGSLELVSVLPDSLQSDLPGQLEAMQSLFPIFLETFQSLAAEYSCIIVAQSFPWRNEEGKYINRNWVFSPKGSGYQDKWFMTRFEEEDWGISSPRQLEYTVFQTAWCRFGIQICFDVEFPSGAHQLVKAGADLILAPSCTETIRGATRVHVGARARALEQQVYVAVAQSIGEAKWCPALDLNYGYAAIYSSPDVGMPETGILSAGVANEPTWLVKTIDFEPLRALQTSAQVFNRKGMQGDGMGVMDGVVVRVVEL